MCRPHGKVDEFTLYGAALKETEADYTPKDRAMLEEIFEKVKEVYGEKKL